MTVKFQHVRPPDGDLIRVEAGRPVVGARPIVGLLRGDGTGLDITPVMQRVVDAAVEKAYAGERAIAWCPIFVGLEALQRHGEVLPREAIDAIAHVKVAIKGPFTTPIGDEKYVCLHCAHQQDAAGRCEECGRDDGVAPRFRSINVGLRQALDLYGCVRPVRYFPGVPAPNRYADKVDFVIFRENTEDVYAGHDYERGGEAAQAVIALVKRLTGRDIRPDSGIGVKPISETGSKRLVRMAIRHAIAQKLPSVTIVHKGNIMKFTEGAFAKWGYEVAAAEFADVTVTEKALRERFGGVVPAGRIVIKDRIADSIFQQIQTRPDEYSVLATTNLNGDYLSDAAIALVGGLGLGPGANIGDEAAVFEATHGTAPKYAGQDKVNPGSILLSSVMMLRHLGWNEAAELVTRGIARSIADAHVTYDLARLMRAEGREDVTELSSSGFGQAIVARM